MTETQLVGGRLRRALTAATTTTGGDCLNLENPFGVDVVIERATLHVSTKSTGAATLDIGVEATGTSDDTLFDGVDVGTAAGEFDNITNKGTNGSTSLLWESDKFLTITPSATVAGLVAEIFLTCAPCQV